MHGGLRKIKAQFFHSFCSHILNFEYSVWFSAKNVVKRADLLAYAYRRLFRRQVTQRRHVSHAFFFCFSWKKELCMPTYVMPVHCSDHCSTEGSKQEQV